MSSPEQFNGQEKAEIKAPSAERRVEKLPNNPESKPELSPRDTEARAEKARNEALEKAVSVEAGGKEKAEKHTDTPRRRGPISKKQREQSFSQTMHHVQNELNAPSRTFSKVIHNKYIEKTSEIVGGSIARPNAILAGAFMAFLLTLIIYVIAKTFGYNLSGFETIGAFIIGWILGVVYDYLKILFVGKKY